MFLLLSCKIITLQNACLVQCNYRLRSQVHHWGIHIIWPSLSCWNSFPCIAVIHGYLHCNWLINVLCETFRSWMPSRLLFLKRSSTRPTAASSLCCDWGPNLGAMCTFIPKDHSCVNCITLSTLCGVFKSSQWLLLYVWFHAQNQTIVLPAKPNQCAPRFSI